MFSKKGCGQMQTTVTQTHVQLRHSTQQQQQQYSGSNTTTTTHLYYYFWCTRKTKQPVWSGRSVVSVVSNTTNKQRYETTRDETISTQHNSPGQPQSDITVPSTSVCRRIHRCHFYNGCIIKSSSSSLSMETADHTKRFSNNKKLHVQQHGKMTQNQEGI
jgi:hypothetical protein